MLTRLLQARLALALIGVFIFGYGVRVDDPRVRWVGIGCLAFSLLLRWLPARRPPE
jgi:hypothetical protein